PVDAGNHRFAKVLDQVKDCLTAMHMGLGFDRVVSLQLINIRSGNERLLARPSEDDDARVSIRRQLGKDLLQLSYSGRIERVENLGAVDCYIGDAVFLFEFDVLHAFSLVPKRSEGSLQVLRLSRATSRCP